MRTFWVATAAILAIFVGPATHAQTVSPLAETPIVAVPVPVVPMARAGTRIRVMVMNEVSTKTAKPADRFLMQAETAVLSGDKVVIPAGAKAWGEVVTAEKSGAFGKMGKLAVRPLYIEVRGEQLALVGNSTAAGDNTGEFIFGAVLSPLGLFAPGNNGRLKAGDIIIVELARDYVVPQPNGVAADAVKP